MTTRIDALSDAHERLSGYAYVDGPGFAVHAPMGAEALSSAGYDDLVATWIEAYKASHEPIPAPPRGDAIDGRDEASWRPALGQVARASDWAVLFDRELRDEPWPSVLTRWLPRLLPGHAGGLTHGLLRTAHAVRALPVQAPAPDLLLAELARGLAYWAATFRSLPGEPHLRGPLGLEAAIAAVPRPREPWNPVEAGTFARIGELTGFGQAVAAHGLPEASDEALSELTAAFCRLVLSGPPAVIGPIHAVTPAVAVRTLLPYLPSLAVEAVYARLWHVGAAIVAGFVPPDAALPPAADPAPAPAAILARAAEHRDTHAIKFAEACVREHALRPDPVYLLAAQHVLDTLPAW
ncbi:MAG TPA: hypothetical protein VFZ77_09370 [Acidimicrobiales bacterium]